MRIVIFGANGQTGRLADQASARRRPHHRGGDSYTRRLPVHRSGADGRGRGRPRRSTRSAPSSRDADAVLSTLGVPFTPAVGQHLLEWAPPTSSQRCSPRRPTRLVVVSSTGAYPAPGRTGAPFALRLFEPVITKTIGKTVYDDIRLMESVVRDSDLDWTIVRPSGLFDLPHVTEYTAGEVDPVGAFTSRSDLADYLVALAATGNGSRDTVTVSTTAEHAHACGR